MRGHVATLDRQWLMLQAIPRYPHKITAGELAGRLRDEGCVVTRRTVERDLAALSDSFPLVADERSKPFGWSWQKHAQQFSVPGMSPLQATVLMLARTHLHPLLPAHLLEPLRSYFAQAEATLRQALGSRGLANWDRLVEIVQPTQPLLPPRINGRVVALVHEALATGRQAVVRYRSRGAGKSTRYRVHPLGLVYRGAIGYLVCTIEDYADIRQLALHRIETARVLDAECATPTGFDLHAYAQSGAFGFMDHGPIRLVFRMTAIVAEHLYETRLSDDQRITPDSKGGWVRISATVRDTSQLRWWLRGFGPQAEVLQPAALRRELTPTANGAG